MAGFKGKQLRDTYKSILNLGESNNEVTGSIQTVKDGSGNNTALGVSTDAVQVTTADGTFLTPTSAGSSGQVLTSDGPGQPLYWTSSTATIDFQNFDQDLIPDQDQLRSLGTSARQWKDVFVGPGSLYVNAKRVISDDSGTIVVSTDDDQNLSVKTTGTGNLELAAEGTGALTFKSDINVQNGFAFYSTSSEIDFGDDINMNSRRIKNLDSPVGANDALRKTDLDNFDPTTNLGYTPLDKSGDQMGGNLDMQSNRVTNLAEPVSDSDSATKVYVDNVAAGLNWKKNVRVVQTLTAEISGYSYNIAQEPQGNVWSGVTVNPVIDGITLMNGDRLLITNASDARGNGLFYWDSGNSSFYRTSDSDNTPSNEVRGGGAVFASEGNTYSDTGWVMSSPTGDAVLGTDNLSWTQFSGVSDVTAGDGLSKTGNELSVDTTVARTDRDEKFNGKVTFKSDGFHIREDSSANSVIAFDDNDFIIYNRSNDTFTLTHGGSAGFSSTTLNFRPRFDAALGLGGPSIRWLDLHSMEGTFYGPVFLDAGTSAQPSLAFSSQTNKGFFYNSSDTIGIAVDGKLAARFVGEGTNLANIKDVVTREKGDARYALLSAPNTFIGDQTINGKLNVNIITM